MSLDPLKDPRGRGPNESWMAEINMVPFIDIVLVLLVIFMITAPLMVRGIDVDLPESGVNTLRQEERIIVTVKKDESIYLDKKRVDLAALRADLKIRKEDNPEVTLYLRADRQVPYGTIVQVMDQIKGVGIDRMGMVTEPLAGSER
jgi:biopolymer transport protein TolR